MPGITEVDKMFRINDKFNEQILEELKSLGLCNDSSIPHQIYTLNHKQAFLATQLVYEGAMSKSGILHDLDKLVTYGMMAKSEASKLHLRYARHHISVCKTELDLEDCIIDYECARFTKEDKPLNAYDTIIKFCPDKYEILKPALVRLGLGYSSYDEPSFEVWRQLNISNIQPIISKNIKAIKKLYSDIERFGVEKGVEKFYY